MKNLATRSAEGQDRLLGVQRFEDGEDNAFKMQIRVERLQQMFRMSTRVRRRRYTNLQGLPSGDTSVDEVETCLVGMKSQEAHKESEMNKAELARKRKEQVEKLEEGGAVESKRKCGAGARMQTLASANTKVGLPDQEEDRSK